MTIGQGEKMFMRFGNEGLHWRPWGEHLTGKMTVIPGFLWV